MTGRTFLDRSSPPHGRELEDMLGPATALWTQLLHDLASGVPVWESWRFADRSRGWRLRLTRRATGPALYLTPRRGYFVAAFGGRDDRSGRRVEVRDWRDLAHLEELASVALAS